MRKLRIAMIGVRGIPATYGGVEKHVEELAVRLCRRGHHVSVFCRSFYTPDIKEYKGVEIVRLPTLNQKHLEMIVHTFLSAIYLIFRTFDIVHIHSIDPGLVTPLRVFKHRRRIIITSHGQAYRRGKWGRIAKAVSKLAEKISIKNADEIISVSKTLKKYYRDQYAREVSYIPNGVDLVECYDSNLLPRHGIEKRKYILFVGRLIPTKGCDFLIEAFKKVKTDMKLVIVGGSSHSDNYESELKKRANENTVFLGYQYGEDLWQLYANCKLFIFPSEIEGLPIVLLEALSFGIPVIYSDIPENVEVAEDIGIPFKNTNVLDLSEKMNSFFMNTSHGEELAKKAKKHIDVNYNWDNVVEKTESVYFSVC